MTCCRHRARRERRLPRRTDRTGSLQSRQCIASSAGIGVPALDQRRSLLIPALCAVVSYLRLPHNQVSKPRRHQETTSHPSPRRTDSRSPSASGLCPWPLLNSPVTASPLRCHAVDPESVALATPSDATGASTTWDTPRILDRRGAVNWVSRIASTRTSENEGKGGGASPLVPHLRLRPWGPTHIDQAGGRRACPLQSAEQKPRPGRARACRLGRVSHHFLPQKKKRVSSFHSTAARKNISPTVLGSPEHSLGGARLLHQAENIRTNGKQSAHVRLCGGIKPLRLGAVSTTSGGKGGAERWRSANGG